MQRECQPDHHNDEHTGEWCGSDSDHHHDRYSQCGRSAELIDRNTACRHCVDRPFNAFMHLRFHSLVITALFAVKIAQWSWSLQPLPRGPSVWVSAIFYLLPFMVLLAAILLAQDKFDPAKAIRAKRENRAEVQERKIARVLVTGVGILVAAGILGAMHAPERVLLLVQSINPTGLEKHQVAMAWREHWTFGLLAFCTTLVIAPVLEELYYRGLLLNHWAQKKSLVGAVMGSTAIFVVAHVHFSAEFDWSDLVHIGAASLLLCYAYMRLGLMAAVAIHAVINAWSSTLMLMAHLAQRMMAA